MSQPSAPEIAPDLNVFLDVANLRSGEYWESKLFREILGTDVLYLFRSAAASVAHWVEKEWRCALERRGVNFIDPVPLVSPEDVPAPEELGSKHLNDCILAYPRGRSKSGSSREGL